MKILMATNTYLPVVGGLERSIQSFTDQLRQWGHEVVIAVPQLSETEAEEAGIVKIPAIHVDQPTDFSVPLPLMGPLVKLVDSFKPDIIHAHHPFWMGEMALRLATHCDKPLVFTYHIMFDQYAHYLPIPLHLAKRFLVEFAVGYSNLSTRVIAPSESVRKILLKEGITTPIDIVPTGVEVALFAHGNRMNTREHLGIPPDAFVVGYAGRLEPEKNLEFLAQTMSEFMKNEKTVHFLVVGKGTSEPMIQKIFSESGLTERLHLAGIAQGSALADCYHAMDLFAFASKSETQGMVLCEAMASGIPVVALDAPGVREVVTDHFNGRLVSREENSEFRDALFWSLEQNQMDEQWQRLKEGAWATAKSFSLESCTLRLLDVYQSAIQNYLSPSLAEQDQWHRMTRQFKTEWHIMANFGHATKLALKEIV